MAAQAIGVMLARLAAETGKPAGCAVSLRSSGREKTPKMPNMPVTVTVVRIT